MEQKALDILENNIYATVATSTLTGQPWNSPVYVVYDENVNFYWASGKESQHSRNIYTNPKAFLVIYDSSVPWGTGEGLFIEAEVTEVDDPAKISKVCELRSARGAKSKQLPEDFLDDRPRRIYCASPKRAWINRDGKVSGFFVDERSEIVLANLKRLLISQ